MTSPATNLAASPRVRHALLTAKAVCFDVDSTVITTEGIDELAAFEGQGAAVAALTKRAMGGSVPMRDALDARLRLIRPTSARLAAFLAQHPPQLTCGVAEVVAQLQRRGTHVFLVSGGFSQMILPVAARLSIPPERVFANTLLFDAAGAYAGFDLDALTSQDGGKAEVLRRLVLRGGYTPIVMVGDGATDLQARPPADVFVGFGGVVDREVVRRGSDWMVYSFEQVLDVLRETPT